VCQLRNCRGQAKTSLAYQIGRTTLIAGHHFGLNPAFLDKGVISDLFPELFISASSFLQLTIIARNVQTTATM
jgi:hypothetical protein